MVNFKNLMLEVKQCYQTQVSSDKNKIEKCDILTNFQTLSKRPLVTS